MALTEGGIVPANWLALALLHERTTRGAQGVGFPHNGALSDGTRLL